jgi:alginate O-acetyltransferase complex protein AlgI
MLNTIVSLFVPQNTEGAFSVAIWLAGIGHFCVLIASFQVPARLGWKEDLQKLTSFNRKLMWVHGGFAVLTIIAFGTLTLALHAEMLRGDRAALGLALFIGVYWALRIAVDFLYYDHKDWPRGRGFVVGHILLTALFAFLTATNLGLVYWKSFVH